MPLLRKILKVLAWTAGCLAGLCALLYLVLVIVNWRDAEPSATALRMAELHRNRPVARDEDNAFIHVMGFEVAPGESPLEIGRRRIEWLRRHEGPEPLDPSADPLGKPPGEAVPHHSVIDAYFEACGPRGPACVAAFKTAGAKFDEWKDPEAWLLERYNSLLDLHSWREFVPTDMAAPLPSYQVVMNGQKLFMLHAQRLASKHDAAGVKQMLSADLRFWRMALQSSDILISKMIATAAILRHFKLGAIILRTLPPERVREATPTEWRAALTDGERSMRRCLIGEWIFGAEIIRDNHRELLDTLVGDGAFAKLTGPFFQPQDTINLSAEQLTQAAQMFDTVPLAEYEAAARRVSELAAAAADKAWPPRSLYNMSGRIIWGSGLDYGDYAIRVGDLEGVRRSALAALSLHEESVASQDVPAALALSPYRNPYNDRPFGWDAAGSEIVFRGLEPGERGDHRIRIH